MARLGAVLYRAEPDVPAPSSALLSNAAICSGAHVGASSRVSCHSSHPSAPAPIRLEPSTTLGCPPYLAEDMGLVLCIL